jgi:hypothetical protein
MHQAGIVFEKSQGIRWLQIAVFRQIFGNFPFYFAILLRKIPYTSYTSYT